MWNIYGIYKEYPYIFMIFNDLWRPIGCVFLIILYHISALQTQVLLNPGFGKAIGNSLHFPARGTAPKHGFPKPGFGQTWVSGVLNPLFLKNYVIPFPKADKSFLRRSSVFLFRLYALSFSLNELLNNVSLCCPVAV